MIFITTGTHEAPFDRLVKYMDDLVGNNVIKEEVVIQTGYSSKTKFAYGKDMFSYDEMEENIKRARIVITHCGSSTIMKCLEMGKVPIVVPRQKKFSEHVNNHQLNFVRKISDKNIVLVEEIDDLAEIIFNYEKVIESKSTKFKSNNKLFNQEFERIVKNLF